MRTVKAAATTFSVAPVVLVAAVAYLATHDAPIVRPGVDEVGHLTRNGQEIIACVFRDGFHRLAAGAARGVESSCVNIAPGGTFKVLEVDAVRDLTQICWPNGARLWVRHEVTRAGPEGGNAVPAFIDCR